jgi:hypothetical protein
MRPRALLVVPPLLRWDARKLYLRNRPGTVAVLSLLEQGQ